MIRWVCPALIRTIKWSMPGSGRPLLTRPAGGPGRAIGEAIPGGWSRAGVGALLAWMWFVDTKRGLHEAMSKAEGWNRGVFWGLIVIGLFLGGYSGLRRSGWTGLTGLA